MPSTWTHGFNLPFLSTDADVKAFMKAHLYPGATDDQVNSIADNYSQDPAEVRHLPSPIHTCPDSKLS